MEAMEELSQLSEFMCHGASLLADDDPFDDASPRCPSTFLNVVALGNVVVRTFREKGIPCDVVWMDINYMNGFRCFTFDSNRFPDPKSMVNDLHSIGCKAIWMLDPGIKKEKGYFVYESSSENDVWIKKADGSPFIENLLHEGEVTP